MTKTIICAYLSRQGIFLYQLQQHSPCEYTIIISGKQFVLYPTKWQRAAKCI